MVVPTYASPFSGISTPCGAVSSVATAGGLVAGLATAACAADCRGDDVAMPGAATVSLKRCGAGVGVMRGGAPVAITRGAAGGFVAAGTFGGGAFDFWESSFATVPKPQASASTGRQRVQRSTFLTRVASKR